ncbi:MAG: SprT-like domain-containing protein [Verrucomicrobiae bacterium]
MKYQQILLNFGRAVMRRVLTSPDDLTKPRRKSRLRSDPLLEDFASQLLVAAGCSGLQISVFWNPSLRTTAGMACWRDRRITLNPRLVGISAAEVQRTLRHELAHLLSQHRAGRRRIEAHGKEWKKACADLGIPNEARCHELPFKRHKIPRKYFYACPGCSAVLARVRPLRRRVACVKCCRKFYGGAYHERFRFKPIEPPAQAAA